MQRKNAEKKVKKFWKEEQKFLTLQSRIKGKKLESS